MCQDFSFKAKAYALLFKTIAVALSVLTGWMAWPSRALIAPESTGEIGFMGLLVVAKFAVFFLRCFIAIGLGGIVLAMFMFLGSHAAQPDLSEAASTEPEEDIIPRNPFN